MIFAKKIYIKIALLIVAVFAITTFVTYFTLDSNFNNMLKSFMSFRLNRAMEQINADVYQTMNAAEEIADIVNNNYQTMDEEDYSKLLNEKVAGNLSLFGAGIWFEKYQFNKNTKYFGPYVYRSNGEMIFSDSWEAETYNYLDQGWYKNALVSGNQTVWSRPYLDKVLNISFVTASKRVLAEDRSILGVVSADLDISEIRKEINYALRLSDNSTVFLIDDQGTYIAVNNADKIFSPSEVMNNPLLLNIVSSLGEINKEDNYYNENILGNIVYVNKVDYPGWHMGIAVPRNEAFTVFRDSFMAISAAILFLTVVILLLMRKSAFWVKNVFFENTGTAAVILDKNFKVSMANREFSQLSGYSKKEVEELQSLSKLLKEEDFNSIKSYLAGLQKKAESIEQRHEIQILSKDGTYRDSLINMGLITGTEYSIMSFMDITGRKSMEKKLEFLSYHDVLTGFYNRTYFEEILKELDKKGSYAMVICDIDGLKFVNDTFGHTVGDQMLINATNLIKAELEAEDIAARIGGDEFAIIIRGERSYKADLICSRICERIKEYNLTQTRVFIEMSFGSAKCEGGNKTSIEAYIEADNNMYREKIKNKQNKKN